VHPTLLRFDTGPDALGELTVSAYFGMVAIGFTLAIFLLWYLGGKRGIKRDSLLDLGLYMVIFGVLGARLLHVVADGQLDNYINWCVDPDAVVWNVTESECRSRSLDGVWDSAQRVCRPGDPGARPAIERCTLWLQFWQGGLAFYGGFLLASLFGIYFIRKEKLPLARVLDMTGWAIPFGLAWGRMGCFLNGCCYGVDVPHSADGGPWWAVAFPRWSPAWRDHFQQELIPRSSELSLYVHPTQLYESFAALAIAGFAYFYLEPRRRFGGEVFLSTCALYAFARFVIEFFRADQRGELLGLSTSQLIALGVVAVVAVAWGWFRRADKGVTAVERGGA
jgi:phosphatidylglycerol---prolipoprotein diacylglyceryl transferase